MKRRQFITLLGGAAAWPLVARAQQPKTARLGWVTTGTAAAVNPFIEALRAGLADHGYIEGRNLTIAERYADGDIDRVLPLAEELSRLPVDLIATQGTATRQLQKLSATVPIVYVFSADPVLGGFADSLARPGRNMTGITVMSIEQLSSCRGEIADRFGRVKAGAVRPRAARGYGLDSAKSISAMPTVRSAQCADRCDGRPKRHRRGPSR